MPTKKVTSHFFLGISVQGSDKGVSVAGVLAGAPAAGAKIRTGDVIETINGASVSSMDEIPQRLRRRNDVGVRRGRRRMHLRASGVDLTNEREVAELLVGKGDRVFGLGHIYLDRHCDESCNCVDDGMACEIWYSFEGVGEHRGVLLKQHCRSLQRDFEHDFKYKWVDKQCAGGTNGAVAASFHLSRGSPSRRRRSKALLGQSDV